MKKIYVQSSLNMPPDTSSKAASLSWFITTTLIFAAILWSYHSWLQTIRTNRMEEAFVEKLIYEPELEENSLSNLEEPPPTLEAIKTKMKTIVVKTGDSFSVLLKKIGISKKTQNALMVSDEAVRVFKNLHPNQRIDLDFDEMDELKALLIHYHPTKSLSLKRQTDGSYAVEHILHPETIHLVAKGTQITHSLFLDGQKAKISENILLELAEIFAWDIDFALDLQPNDSFKVIYEERYNSKGEYLGSGKILAAEFMNSNKIYRAIRYTDPSGYSDYYNEEGFSLRKAFIRTPVKFSRISSYFSKGRKHPVLHTLRAHKGVDYAAPAGTPVKATGFGKVVERGWKGGYGNTLVLKHGKRYSTLYGHLSRFAPHVKLGKTVQQGEIIGFVGSTGLATGPHLHYEFHIDGSHHDPLTVDLPRALPLAENYYSQFQRKFSELSSWFNQPELPVTLSVKESL